MKEKIENGNFVIFSLFILIKIVVLLLFSFIIIIFVKLLSLKSKKKKKDPAACKLRFAAACKRSIGAALI